MSEVSDERLAQIIDHGVPAFDWEIRILAAELLARRAGDRHRKLASMREVIAELEQERYGRGDL